MPASLIEIPMSIDDFRVMPHRLGWKHEYWDGMARLSPSHGAVAKFELRFNQTPPASSTSKSTYDIRGVGDVDRESLVQLHINAFDDSIEFAGYSDAAFEKEQRRSMSAFFAPENSTRRRRGLAKHSFAVVDGNDSVAAIFIRETPDGLAVEPILVHPRYHRKGLASALFWQSCRALASEGVKVLRSSCHLGNHASMKWHLAMGFRETPNVTAASARANHHHWMARHHRFQGRLNEAESQTKLARSWDQKYESWQEAWIAEIEQSRSEAKNQ
ncbi:Acetyltransferase (GNAT) family protein [Rubripirellula obstinata]|uniref:Acetyltransferase (GNAT) family protein n=1 Tax=Rubripirellula obstinata TaxID=406547 RepID=A0A5B1CEC1_9BACT|nr:GNAT family N-acetyltransferase [Rubripirellula obstinata]KAA1259498.1 Acetyltransferase (GNAT) family protein [Rubripirellula obstinata]